jgi:hypothetical protein
MEEGIGSVADPCSVTNQARGDGTLPLSLHLLIREIGKLILKMKATGDHRDETSKPASVLRLLNPTRLVALCKTIVVHFLQAACLFCQPHRHSKADISGHPDERSTETSKRVEGEIAEGKNQEDEESEYRLHQRLRLTLSEDPNFDLLCSYIR